MGRGVSYGGGQSSLGYLFGGDEAPKPAAEKPLAPVQRPAAEKPHAPVQRPAAEKSPAPVQTPAPSTPATDKLKEIPAGIQRTQPNNYFRAQGQNCGNFLTERPSAKVHAAPGGGSTLGYLFGGSGGDK